MRGRYLLVTDWIIDVLNGQEHAIETLLELAPHGLALSLISYGELFEGAAFSRNPQVALAVLQTFLTGKEVFPLTTAIMEQFALVRGQLPRKLRQQIGDMDLLIAATALHHGLILLTRNLKDFQHVPDLHLYQSG
jgi:tRNA(fMet)-specific endonuclease VapC